MGIGYRACREAVAANSLLDIFQPGCLFVWSGFASYFALDLILMSHVRHRERRMESISVLCASALSLVIAQSFARHFCILLGVGRL